jgi:hypothetical protein
MTAHPHQSCLCTVRVERHVEDVREAPQFSYGLEAELKVGKHDRNPVFARHFAVFGSAAAVKSGTVRCVCVCLCVPIEVYWKNYIV